MDVSEQIRRAISKLARLDRLSGEEVAVLETNFGRPRQVAAREDFVQQGSRPTESILLLQGWSARSVGLADGRRQITSIHVPGDFVDLHGLLVKTMDHSVTALSACVVVPLPHSVLIDITQRFPHLTRLLWLSTLVDASIHRTWLASMGRRTSLEGLAHLLCELYCRLEVVGLAGNHVFQIPLTQQELADALGISDVHANRVVQELRGTGLVEWRSRSIQIVNWRGLADLAEFDPQYLHLESEPR